MPGAAGSAASSRIARLPFFYGVVIVGVNTAVRTHKCFAQANLFTFAVPPMLDDTGLSRATFSSVYGAATFGASFLQPLMGRQVDKYGNRRVMPLALLALGASLAAMTAGSVAPAPAVPGLLLGSWLVMRTTGFAIDNYAAANINQWYADRRGQVMAISNIASQLCQGLVYAQLYERGVERFGWEATQLAGTVGAVLLALLAAVTLRHTPEEVGCWPDGRRPPGGKGDGSGEEEESLLGSEGDPEKATRGSSASTTASRDMTLAEAIRTRTLWLLGLNSFALCTIMAGTDLHLMSILLEGLAAAEGSAGGGGGGDLSIATLMYIPQTLTICVVSMYFGRAFDKGLEP